MWNSTSCDHESSIDMALVGVLVMVIGLLLIPLGLPGLWIMIGVLGVGAMTGLVGWAVVLGMLALAVIAEVLEFVIVKKQTTRFGGSRKAFWGALGGGLLGVMVGAPIPVIGSVIAGFIGSFAGAAAVTWLETKELSSAGRVGWGVVLGRAFSAFVKVAAGLVILVVGGAALLIN
jgi:uncharacterized protein YqgC (DUF456 family)